MIDGQYIKPDPTDPRDLTKRLDATGTPMNKGIAMLLNAPSLVCGYSCQGCGHVRDMSDAPVRMTREQVKEAACGKCGSKRVTLNLKGAM